MPLSHFCFVVIYFLIGTMSQEEGTSLKRASAPSDKPFIFLDVAILREYLQFEFSHDFHSKFDFERMIDDWIFLIFFVGNDFLPHLPSMEIREGAIDMLVDIYKRIFTQLGGYLTDEGNVDIERVKMILNEVGKVEDVIFQQRREREERRMNNEKRRKLDNSRKLEAEFVASKL
jgi:5'-3' exoribonuclease 2